MNFISNITVLLLLDPKPPKPGVGVYGQGIAQAATK